MEDIKIVATNRKARYEYFLTESIEAGIALTGSEIKSVRAGQMSLAEAYVKIDGKEAWLLDSHIAPYSEGITRDCRKFPYNRYFIARMRITDWSTLSANAGSSRYFCTRVKIIDCCRKVIGLFIRGKVANVNQIVPGQNGIQGNVLCIEFLAVQIHEATHGFSTQIV